MDKQDIIGSHFIFKSKKRGANRNITHDGIKISNISNKNTYKVSANVLGNYLQKIPYFMCILRPNQSIVLPEYH